jgi:anti-sigma factor RsiW
MANLSDREREDLVAFLDGELEGARARDVEARLNVDPRFRAEADALKQTWDLLDHLPRAEPSAGFTHRTLERLAVARPPAAAPRRWAAALGWAAAVFVAAAAGYWAGERLAPAPPPAVPAADVEAQLTDHLRVIQNLRPYESVDDIDEVEALGGPDLFGDDADP